MMFDGFKLGSAQEGGNPTVREGAASTAGIGLQLLAEAYATYEYLLKTE
jgi:hypothetical protein